MRFLMILTAILLLPAVCSATTWYVPDDFPAGIQAAINGSAAGDTIIVRQGTYVENINFVGKAVTLKSEMGPAFTTIDGGGVSSVVMFFSGEGSSTVLDGFTITNGTGSLDPYSYGLCGGGIHIIASSPTIQNNVITGNHVLRLGDFGGGICMWGASPTIFNNVVTDNTSVDDGAGIACWDLSTPLIDSNYITYNYAGGCAGGIDCARSSPVICNNVIAWNRAGMGGNADGGGLRAVGDHLGAADPVITNNTIFENAASWGGGGISTFSNTLVARPTVTNTILWGNTAPAGGPQIAIGGGTFTISYSDVEGGQAMVLDPMMLLVWGAGMIALNPAFAGAPAGDFHLTFGSPCQNTGTGTAPNLPSLDYEGNPRVAQGTPDMGADEYDLCLYLTGNPVPGGSVTFNVVGTPGTTPVRIYRGKLRSTPLNTQYGSLYIKKPWKNIWNVGPIPGTGIATTTKTIPGTIPPGNKYYFQALHGPGGNPSTLLTNLLVLQVE